MQIIGKCQLPMLLHQRGITQQQLAEKTGISATQISDYVTGRRVMSLKNAIVISGALGCRMEDLYETTSSDQGGSE